MQAKALIEISDLVLKSAGSLEARLADLILTMSENEAFKEGGEDSKFKSFPVHNLNGFSGYNLWYDDKLIGQLHLASLSSCYYVFMKQAFLEGETILSYDYYNQDGEFVYTAESLDGQSTFYNSINMDPTNPMVNHLYNILHVNYIAAENGMGDSQRIGLIERTLNSLMKTPGVKIGANERRKDPALVNIYNEIHRIEKDPILNWSERQKVYASLKEVRKKILRTKSRAHKFNYFTYQTPVNMSDAKVKLELIKKRPFDNTYGILKKNTWGRVLWFGATVKNNLGLSIAMAIYTPFTFYFITQPMNPHAMYIVGKVRMAYVGMVNALNSPLSLGKSSSLISKDVPQEDSVSTGQAAPIRSKNLLREANAVEEPAQSWDDRMSAFKAMSIAYEGNLIQAARIGRFEQMENQFMVPLTAESAWEEMERYLKDVKNALQYNHNLDARYKQFLENEIERTQDLQVYIWKKIARFLADHPYMVVDQDNDHPMKDYYTGKVFLFMRRMTEKLSKLNLAATPATHDKVMELAQKFEDLKKQESEDGDTVMEELKKNSTIYAQKDVFSSDKIREKLKLQWEMLFLQQTKKQEAATFSLQTYTWSVKNAIWILQSIYSGKREELGSLTFKYNLDNQNTETVKSDKQISDLYASLMNMMVLEFVSIRKEIAENLKGDREAELRMGVIENIKSFLIERDRLFNNGMKMATDSDRDSVTI